MFSFSQNIIYDKKGNSHKYDTEVLKIAFTASQVNFPRQESSIILSLLPTAVDAGFKLITSSLEKRLKKFTFEMSKKQTHLDAGTANLPNASFTRTLKINNEEKLAFGLDIKVKQIDSMQAFYFYIENITLNYSGAKHVKSFNKLDYAIELKPTLLIDGEKKAIEISPIIISTVDFGSNSYTDKDHISDIVTLPSNGVLTELSIKVIESNPVKVRAEKILNLWNDKKDDVKTIINNFLPKNDGSDEVDEQSDNPDDSDGNN